MLKKRSRFVKFSKILIMSTMVRASAFAAEFIVKGFLCLVVLCGTCSLVFPNNEGSRFAENANLALRRTAHQLLLANGDSTSAIRPIQRVDINTYSFEVDSLFGYEALPEILQASLDMYHIKNTYTVSVLDRQNRQIQLGYHVLDLAQPGGVTCGGRRRSAGSYVINVSFQPEPVKESGTGNWWVLPFGSLLAAFGYIVWKRKLKTRGDRVLVSNPGAKPTLSYPFGNSMLDMANLLLVSANTTYNLTYREAKLLNLFTMNPNRVLDRDFILKSVWEDEGIIVGRSVDVFVSRLRKLLANDQHVRISAVHGIGYRMDVSSD
jgi:hypothetical protein